MQLTELFYAWVPRRAKNLILFLFAIAVLCSNGVYLGITTDMYSGSGEYAEMYTMANNALYIGMGTCMIMYVRLGRRFSNKSLVLTGFIATLLMNVVCSLCPFPVIIIIAVLVLGFVKMLALGEVFVAWLKIWSEKMDAARLYPFFYFIALGGLYFFTWLTAYLAKTYNWQYAYIVIYILLLVCIILTLLFVEKHPIKKKYPLYQLDLIGVFYFTLCLMLINYVATYGKVEDWFNSNRIWLASFGATLSGLLFIRQEFMVKRPFFDLGTFKIPQMVPGLIYLVFLGVLIPVTFQTSFSGGVLHFESYRNSEIGLYLLPGIIAGSIFSYYWYVLRFDGQLLVIIGLTAFVIYHIMMYRMFLTDISIDQFWMPSFFKGLALALLYVSIGLYASAKFIFPTNLRAIGVITIARSFLATGIFSGVYNYLLYASRGRHLSELAGAVDANDPMLLQYGENNNGYANFIQSQATLTALKELSGNVILFSSAVIVVLIVIYLFRRYYSVNNNLR